MASQPNVTCVLADIGKTLENRNSVRQGSVSLPPTCSQDAGDYPLFDNINIRQICLPALCPISQIDFEWTGFRRLGD